MTVLIAAVAGSSALSQIRPGESLVDRHERWRLFTSAEWLSSDLIGTATQTPGLTPFGHFVFFELGYLTTILINFSHIMRL